MSLLDPDKTTRTASALIEFSVTWDLPFPADLDAALEPLRRLTRASRDTDHQDRLKAALVADPEDPAETLEAYRAWRLIELGRASPSTIRNNIAPLFEPEIARLTRASAKAYLVELTDRFNALVNVYDAANELVPEGSSASTLLSASASIRKAFIDRAQAVSDLRELGEAVRTAAQFAGTKLDADLDAQIASFGA